MTFPNPGPASQSTGNVAGGPYVAWSGTNTTQVIGPAGALVNLGGGVGGGVALYDGANSITSGTAQFSNANGVTFGFNGQTVTASVVTSYTQTNQTVASGGIVGSGFTTATTAGTAVVGTANSAGVSIGVPKYITTYAAGAATGISSIADSANTQTVGMLSFANSHGVTFGISTGALTATITGSVNVGNATAISGIADSANTQTVGTLSFANSNGISFGLSTGANTATLTASYTVPTVFTTVGLISGINVSASQSSAVVSAITFSNANGITFGYDKTNITASVATAYAGTNSSFAGTNISGSITLNTSGLSLALSGAAGALNQASIWNPYPFLLNGASFSAFSQVGQGSVFIQPMIGLPAAVSLSRFNLGASISIATTAASSFAFVASMALGIYSRNVSTLSAVSSSSQVYQFTFTGASGSVASGTAGIGNFNAFRYLSIPLNVNITNVSDYWLAVWSLTSSTNNNGVTVSNLRIPQNTATLIASLPGATNLSNQLFPGLGILSVSSATLPGSIAFSDIIGQGNTAAGSSTNQNQVYVNAVNFTA